jgi:hypothetical protein
MSKLTRGLVLLVLLGSIFVPASADAAGRIIVYFDVNGTERTIDSPGVGQLSTVFVYGEDFGSDFVTGVQYAIDYGPHLTFIADLGLPPVYIGTSATGISMGFGNAPKPGVRFLVHLALVQWNSDCATTFNGDIVTGPHPQFPDATPIVTRFPDQAVVAADGARSQSCQLVEMDIAPLVCPNAFSSAHWSLPEGVLSKPRRGAWLAVAILGSDWLDTDAIDRSSILLEGVPQLPPPVVAGRDLGFADGGNYCGCVPGAASSEGVPAEKGDDEMMRLLRQDLSMDGREDMLMFFDSQDLARAISTTPPKEGSEIELSLTGVYQDGMPFAATGCVVVVAPGDLGRIAAAFDGTASLGFPTPNPFNPVTRIDYSLASTQHVRVAVYDVAGRLVEELVDEVKGAGDYVLEWDAGSLPSGVYFYRLQTGSETIVRRATLLK